MRVYIGRPILTSVSPWPGLRQSRLRERANQEKCPLDRSGILANSLRNIAPAQRTPQIDQAAAQGRQYTRSITAMHLVAIFAHRHISNIMLAVLNRPMPA